MKLIKETVINTGIDKAWDVLGKQFTEVHKWASAVSHSEGDHKKFESSDCSERGCSTSIGSLKEKLLSYSNETHSLSYEVYEGMPAMFKSAKNDWRLYAISMKQTKLIMEMEMTTSGFMAKIMSPILKIKMSQLTHNIIEEFKYYVEHDSPHPRKIKVMRKVI